MVALNENTTLGLNAVMDRLMTLNREDYAIPCEVAAVGQVGNSFEIMAVDGGMHLPSFRMTDHARTQLNNRWAGLNTFSRTLDRDGHQDIYLDTVNNLLTRDDRKLVVRTIDPEGDERIARAVVSDAFKPIDDNIIVPEICSVIGDHSDEWRSLGGQITDTNTYIRFITRRPELSLNIGGKDRSLHIGFQYRNSEVGLGFAEFSAFLFDAFCENGCVFGTRNIADVRYAHRGTRIGTDFGRIFEERIQRQELLNIQGSIVDATRLAVQGAYVPEIRQLLEDAINCKIPEGVKTSDFIQRIGKDVGLTEAEQEAALVHYDGTDSKYGIQAAITAMAQEAPTYTRRVELEQAGGKVISMSDKAWKSIAALAA